MCLLRLIYFDKQFTLLCELLASLSDGLVLHYAINRLSTWSVSFVMSSRWCPGVRSQPSAYLTHNATLPPSDITGGNLSQYYMWLPLEPQKVSY